MYINETVYKFYDLKLSISPKFLSLSSICVCIIFLCYVYFGDPERRAHSKGLSYLEESSFV